MSKETVEHGVKATREDFLKYQKDERGIDGFLLLTGYEPWTERVLGKGLTAIQIVISELDERESRGIFLYLETNASFCGCGWVIIDPWYDDCYECNQMPWRHSEGCVCPLCQQFPKGYEHLLSEKFSAWDGRTIVSCYTNWDEDTSQDIPETNEQVESLLVEWYGEAGKEALRFADELRDDELTDDERHERLLTWRKEMNARFGAYGSAFRDEPSQYWSGEPFGDDFYLDTMDENDEQDYSNDPLGAIVAQNTRERYASVDEWQKQMGLRE